MTRTLSIICFALSGVAGLIYEVCWIRQASLVFGSTTLAFSTVLATFFGGLALGSWLFAGIAQRAERPLRWYAVLELALAAIALVSPLAFELADDVYGAIYRAWTDDPAWLAASRMFVVAALLLPPTVLMGGTLPFFCRQFVSDQSSIAGSVGALYAINTLGAATGCLAAGFYLLPAIGIHGSIAIGAALNAAAGIAVWPLRARAPATTAQSSDPEPSGEGRRSLVSLMFFTIGLVAIGSQVLWARFLALLVPNTVHTYTITLAVVLVGIVLGSFLASRLFDGRLPRVASFGAFQILTGVSVAVVMYLPAETWASLGGEEAMCALLMLAPATLSGASFPLAIRIVLSDPSRAAGTVGRMTALNTFGGIVGAMGVGMVSLPLLGMAGSLWLLTGLSVLVGIVAWLRLERPRSLAPRLTAAAAAVVAWVAVPYALGTSLPRDLLAPPHRLVDHREGASASLAVVRNEGLLQLDIDRWWQGEDRKNHQIMATHIPMLHAEEAPAEVLVVGFGTGQAPGRVAYYDIARLDCIDIEPTIFDFVKEHFDTSWMADPRVNAIHEDGRSYLVHTAETYDLISIEIGQLFRPGVASFYSADFYRRATERLVPGGLLVQFVPLAFTTEETFCRLIRTFTDAFPQAALWYNTAELLIVGVAGAPVEITPAALARIENDERLAKDLRYSQWGGERHWLRRPGALLGGFLCGPEELAALGAGAEPFVDDIPALEYAAASVDPAARHELAVVKKIREQLGSVSSILQEPMPAEVLREAQAVQAKNLDDIEARAHLRLGRRLFSTGGTGEGLRLLELALKTQPDDISCMRRLADAYDASNRLAEAEELYLRAVAASATDALSHRGLGLVYLKTERAQQAVATLTSAVTLRPNDPVSHNYLGAALAREGRPREAMSHLQRALELWPGYPSALIHLDLVEQMTR